MGGCFSFVVLPTCEIRDSPMHYQCRYEVRMGNISHRHSDTQLWVQLRIP